MSRKHDLIIVGAGPAGLACAIEATRYNLDFLVLEQGTVVNSIYQFPENMTFFTTAELLEIGNIPFTVRTEKPIRLDALKYYRRVAQHYQLPIRDQEKVLSVGGMDGDFIVTSRNRLQQEVKYYCCKVIVAVGYYDNPNLLDIPGEGLDKVTHYYTDPHPYFQKKVAVIGGKNSAAIAALELYRNGAEVTLIHRGEAMSSQVKYWILPDINNRIKNQEIRALFNTRVVEIRPEEIDLQTERGALTLKNDFVFALTGYHPDIEFLRSMGIKVDEKSYIPSFNPETLESNVAGIYLAGAMISGKMTNRIFIENGRFHGEIILADMASALEGLEA